MEAWRFVSKLNDHFHIMVQRNSSGAPIYAPLYIHTISSPKPKAPHISTLTTLGSKLQHYRCEKLLFQADMAKRLGIHRSTYIRYETGRIEYCPLDTLQKIAEILDVDVACLLDDYNSFLHRGQAQQIKTLRESTGLSMKAFARLHGIYGSTVRSWERGESQISKALWSRLFQ